MKYRQKRGTLPREPENLAEIQLSDSRTETRDQPPQPVLILESGPESPDGVFASPTQLIHLATAEVWFRDVTFSTEPRLFHQLHVIRAALGESAVTCVYEALVELLNYFDTTYVTGCVRHIMRPVQSHRIQPMRIRRIPFCSHCPMERARGNIVRNRENDARTNNFSESWYHGNSTSVAAAPALSRTQGWR